jgi:DNA-binding NtrC family response regulator
MSKLSSLPVTAQVFDDGMLGVKMPTDLRPGKYEGVLVVQRSEPAASVNEKLTDFVPLPQFLEQARADYIRKALDACGGNRTQAAKLLAVDVRTVFRALSEE